MKNPSASRKPRPSSPRVEIPLASGACKYVRHEFRKIFAAQCLDIIQPDICVCGSIWEIAAMAEAHCVMVASHNPMTLSPLSSTSTSRPPNFIILKYHPTNSLRQRPQNERDVGVLRSDKLSSQRSAQIWLGKKVLW